MMRRLVDRHRGILPLDTAESIWRVIISTFTYVQAPFSVHADLSAGDAAMRDSARFHFGFTVPFLAHMGAASVVAAGWDIESNSTYFLRAFPYSTRCTRDAKQPCHAFCGTAVSASGWHWTTVQLDLIARQRR